MTQRAKTHSTALRHIREALASLVALPQPTPEEAADIIGALRHIETQMGEWRRAMMAETPNAAGQSYRLVTKRRARRSFNWTQILNDVGSALNDANMMDTIMYLRRERAIRFTGQWSNLKRTFEKLDIPLTAAPREIEDTGELTEVHVGELWEEYTAQEAIEEVGA